MYKKILITTGAAAMLFSGCASIVDGGKQKVNFQAAQPVNIIIDGMQYSAPAVIEINRSKSDKIVNVPECNKNVILKSETNGWFWGNIIFGGLLGSTTDYSTDAMWQYDQDTVNINCN